MNSKYTQSDFGIIGKSSLITAPHFNYIRSEVDYLPKIINGPQDNKASKTAASVEMLNGLENLQQVSELYLYDALNLLSCITLDVKTLVYLFASQR